MSETEVETEVVDEVVTHGEQDRPTLARAYDAVEIAADGRTVEMLCVPFGVPATVADLPPYGDGRPYEEEFAHGAFARAARAPNRTLLEFEHWSPGLSGVIGHGSHLEERPDALYGRFRVLRQPDGDKALELIHEGVLRSASVFFEPIRSVRTALGRVRRELVKLERVSLCREGAYPQAQILAVRTKPTIAEEDLLPKFDPELAAKLTAIGLEVPDRLTA